MKNFYVYVVTTIMLIAIASCGKEEWVPNSINGYDLKASDEMIDYKPQTVMVEIEKATIKGLSEYDQFSYECDILVKYVRDGVESYEPSGDMVVNIPWCHISDVEQDGKKLVKLDFDENDTDEIRGIRVWIKTPGNNDSVADFFGFCDVFQLPKDDVGINKIKIRYRGEIHESGYHYNEGTLVFHDDKFSKLLDQLHSDENIGMIILDSEIVDYYDLDDENFMNFTQELDRSVPADTPVILRDDLIMTRAANDGFQFMNSGDLGYFAMFDDSDYTGQNLHTVVTNFHNSYNLPNLSGYDMNDKISSLAVGYNGSDPKVCAVLTIWDDADYNYGDNDRKKHRISIVASHRNPKVARNNLKTIRCINSSDNWNDRISCISCHFGYYDRSLLDY